MSIEDFIAAMACRLRSHIGSRCDAKYHSEDEALAALFQAEREAARYQLPQFAESLVRQCAHTDPSGLQCSRIGVTPPIYGFLVRQPNVPHVYEDACWPFHGALCEAHVGHLIVPPASWWPAEEDAPKAVLV